MPRRPAERFVSRRVLGALFAGSRPTHRLWAAAPLAGALLCPLAGGAQEEPPAPAVGAEPTAAPNPLAVEPGSPTEFVQAAARLRRIGRPGLARRYLRSLLDSQPTDDALLTARDALGPAIFFELSTDPQLRPEGQTLQTLVREAFTRRGADPARLDGLIDNLTAEPRERDAAVAALEGLGAAAAPRLVERLILSADPTLGDERLGAAISSLLGKLGEDAVPPLSAALGSPAVSSAGRSAVAGALGGTRSQAALDALLAPAFASDERPAVQLAARSSLSRLTDGGSLRGLSDAAADRLRNRAEALLSAPPTPAAAEETAELFRYDGTEDRLVPVTLDPAVARRYAAADAASAAARVAPGRESLRTLELVAALAYEASLVGRGRFLPRGEGTVHRAALSAGQDRLLDVLGRALDLGAADAAAAALQILLDAPTADLLRPGMDGASPVERALSSPAPEVRFLAALLAARANPGADFTEGAAVVDVLAGALADAPGGRAVVIDPNGERGSRMAGLLQGLGYRVELAEGVTDGFGLAVAGAGADLVAVHANVQDRPLSSVVANLRADARTRSVPLVLYGDERLELPLSRIAVRAGEATFVPFPIAAETLERQLEPLRSAAPPLPDDLKADQKRAAAFELGRLARTEGRAFPLRGALAELSDAVADSSVSADVSAALATVPDPAAQNALAEVLTVIRPGVDAELAAADALMRSVRRYGSLLRSDVIDALRRRAAAETDSRVQDALLSLAATLPGEAVVLPVEVALPQD